MNETILMKNQVYVLRKELIMRLETLKYGEYLDINTSKDVLGELIFKTESDGRKEIAIPFCLFKKINLDGVSFKDVNIVNLNFNGAMGVQINPQTIWDKDCSSVDFANITVIGSFDDCIYDEYTTYNGIPLNDYIRIKSKAFENQLNIDIMRASKIKSKTDKKNRAYRKVHTS